MQKTTNLQLNKIELSDSPPDISVLNPNWDKIESEIFPTIDPSNAPTGNQGFLRNLIGGLANRIKAITGKTNWFDNPDTTIAELNTNRISKTMITAANDFIVGSANATVAKKTLAETKTILGVNGASEYATGVVKLATAAETTAGTDSTRAVHPAGLKVELDKKANVNYVDEQLTYKVDASEVVSAIAANKILRLNASSQLPASITGNAASANKLATARTINGVSFDGTNNITVADATKLPLAGGTMTGMLIANANTAYTTKQVQNVIESTTAPSGGANGDIWIKYKP